MMYQNKFVVAVKVGGKVLREYGDTVRLPFKSEYSLLIKNLNSVRGKCRIDIDGASATDNTWLVIPPYGQAEIERFIKDGNLSSGRRFRFIARSAEIEAHRGVGAEDGLVRVEFQTEQLPPVITTIYPPNWPYVQSGTFIGGSFQNAQPAFTATYLNQCDSTPTASLNSLREMSRSKGLMKSAVPADPGITVAGSKSDQRFQTVSDFPTTGVTDVIVLKLEGSSQPMLVVGKIACPSCGRRSKSSAEFCSRCGTALQN